MLEAIGRAIDSRRDELVSLTRELIRIPTVNPPGENYRECCEFVAARLTPRGFAASFVRAEATPGDTDAYPRWNVVLRRDGPAPGSCVHFNSHIDVVETGAGWTFDPFAAEVADGRIYGRGACDMKGGLAASIIAVEAFLELFPDHPGAIEISGTADEESGGYGGVAYLAEKGIMAKPRIDHVIIPEPLNKDRICLGHRGVWWAEIETKGRIAHGSMPFLGDSAIRHMGVVLEAFEAELYPALASRLTTMPVVPSGARRSTMNVNSIHGGIEEGYAGFPSACVADSCRIVIDRRFLIEEDLNAVKGEVRRLLDRLAATREKFSYDLRDLWEVRPTMTERGAPVVRSVASAIEAVLGRAPDYVVSPGTYDQKHIDRIGRVKDCIAYGPGILDLAHQPDEYVVIDDMLDSAKIMCLATHHLLYGGL
ncbi:MAG: acetylornithine deacetylase/succinyl-diaminopimelate desuccinylase family protein [Propylenella sp.]